MFYLYSNLVGRGTPFVVLYLNGYLSGSVSHTLWGNGMILVTYLEALPGLGVEYISVKFSERCFLVVDGDFARAVRGEDRRCSSAVRASGQKSGGPQIETGYRRSYCGYRLFFVFLSFGRCSENVFSSHPCDLDVSRFVRVP